MGCGVARRWNRRLGGVAADVRRGREGGHPSGDRQGARRLRRLLPRARVRRRRPHRQHRDEAPRRRAADGRDARRPPDRTTACASTAWDRRWSAWPATAASSRSAARSSSSSTTCGRRSAWPRCRGRRSSSCSATTRSASARTGRPTSRSSTSPRCGRSPTCRSSARPTPTRRWPRGRRPSTTTDRPSLVLSRQGIPVCTDGSAVSRVVPSSTAHGDTPQIVIVATGSEVALAIAAAEQLGEDGIATRVVSLPSWDRLALQGRSYRDELFPAGVPVLSVEAATTFGWERFADDIDRHRPLRRQRPRRRRARRARHQRRPRRRACTGALRNAVVGMEP